jgi:hypothetical protein
MFHVELAYLVSPLILPGISSDKSGACRPVYSGLSVSHLRVHANRTLETFYEIKWYMAYQKLWGIKYYETVKDWTSNKTAEVFKTITLWNEEYELLRPKQPSRLLR